MDDLSTIEIILCAHGDRRGSFTERNSNLKSVVDYIKSEIAPKSCQIALLSEQGSLEAALAEVDFKVTLILPLIFSDGYFYKKIEKSVGGLGGDASNLIRVAAPLCDWPELSECLVGKVPEGGVLLVAHGSQRSSASRLANERLAARLSDFSKLSVTCAYLEEEPYADQVLADSKEALCVVGLFLGSGLHGAEDWSLAISKSAVDPVASFTIGGMPEFPALVCRKIKKIYRDKDSNSYLTD
ncbi:sirohydrochlorin chelatase [Hirschia litorea]|uniref:Sirohydrochlorin chelatase n=1 Tax=Hirschia litorea TaxID=1199156 RepID=A0ABW2II41_9PROT